MELVGSSVINSAQFNFRNKVHFGKFTVSRDHKETRFSVLSMHYLLFHHEGQLLHSLSPTLTLHEHLRKMLYMRVLI